MSKVPFFRKVYGLIGKLEYKYDENIFQRFKRENAKDLIKTVTFENKFKITLTLSDRYSWSLYYKLPKAQSLEPSTISLIENLFKPWDIFIDMGANIRFTLF